MEAFVPFVTCFNSAGQGRSRRQKQHHVPECDIRGAGHSATTMNKSQLLNAALARKIDILTSYIMADVHCLLIKTIHPVDICLY